MTSAGTVMNIIPSTFNLKKINYTVLGGVEKPSKVLMPVTCLIINRTGSQYRSIVLENAKKCGFERIISIENNVKSFYSGSISKMYPTVKFIQTLEDVNIGDLINLGMSESESPYVLVLRDDMCMEDLLFNSTLAKKLIALDQFCIVPRLLSSDMQGIPVRFIPSASKSIFNVEASISIGDGAATLYPFDHAGLYDKRKFMQLGGFDYTITSPYWQKLDLFVRSWLWGEKTTISTSMQFVYGQEIPEEDSTVDLSYLRFYLKNLLPSFQSDHAVISIGSFFYYRRRSQCGFSEDLKQFKDARRWVAENKYRFKTDATSLIENWR